MELIKEYFDQQIKKLVTKEYLDGKLSTFATKDDLKPLATKEDVEKAIEYIGALVSDTVATPMTKTFEKIVDYLQPTHGFDPKPWLVQEKSPFEPPYPSLFAKRWAEHKELKKAQEENRKKLKKFKL